MMSRRMFVAVAAPCLLLLVAARLSVIPLPDTMLPDTTVKLDTPFTAKPGDVILRAPIVQSLRIVLEAPAKASIAGYNDSVAPGEELTAVIAPIETRVMMGGPSVYFCGRDQRVRSQFAQAMIGDMFSKFETIVRFCFIDRDKDGRLDQVFLAGAKAKELQVPMAIEPVAYALTPQVRRDSGDELQLRYRKYKPESGKIELDVVVHRAGKDEPFDYISTPLHIGNREQGQRVSSNPAKRPYPMQFFDILGAAVGIEGVKPDGEATFVIRKNFPELLFRPYLVQTQTIYVYVAR